MPQLTYLKCRFLLGNGKPNKVERAKIKMQVRDPSGTVLESIALIQMVLRIQPLDIQR